MIKTFDNFFDITEDKIFKFSEFDPIKYNGTILVNQIMEWLRAKLLDEPNSEEISLPLEQFYSECSVDKKQFMTFYNEHEKTQRVKSFKMNINNNIITFNDFKNNEEKE